MRPIIFTRASVLIPLHCTDPFRRVAALVCRGCNIMLLNFAVQEHNVGIKCATITPDEQRMDGEKACIKGSASSERSISTASNCVGGTEQHA